MTNSMDKEHCLKLCLAVYKVTKPFPEKEPLKFNIRKKMNDILISLISVNPSASFSDKKTFFKDIDILDSYFEIAREQNWVHPDNFTILQREFGKLKQEFSGEDSENQKNHIIQKNIEKYNEPISLLPEKNFEALQGRQKKILEIIKQKQECQMSDFENMFEGMSKRTIQRDLEFLAQRGLIKKQGERRNLTYYFA